MATPRIFVSPSDQFNNKYAYGNTTEGDQCMKIARALVSALLRNKFEVKMMQGIYQSLCSRLKGGVRYV